MLYEAKVRREISYVDQEPGVWCSGAYEPDIREIVIMTATETMSKDEVLAWMRLHDELEDLNHLGDDWLEAAFQVFYDRSPTEEDRVAGLWYLLWAHPAAEAVVEVERREAARAAALQADLANFDILDAGPVVRVRDGANTWWCWGGDFEMAQDRVIEAIDGAANCQALLDAIDGAIITTNGRDRGTAADCDDLRAEAIAAGLID